MTKGRAIAIAVIGIALTTILTLSIKYGKSTTKIQQVKADTTAETIPTEYLEWTFIVDVANETYEDKYGILDTIEEKLTDKSKFESDTYCNAQYILNNQYNAIIGTLGFYNIPTEEDQNYLLNGLAVYYYNEDTEYEEDIDIFFKYKYNKATETRIILTTYFNDNIYLDTPIQVSNPYSPVSIRINGTNNIIESQATITIKLYVINPTENTKWYILDEYYTIAETKLYKLEDLTGSNDFLYYESENNTFTQDPSENMDLGINLFDTQIGINHTIEKYSNNNFLLSRYNITTDNNEITNRQINTDWTYNASANDYQWLYNQKFQFDRYSATNHQIIDTQIQVANIEVENFNEQINTLQDNIIDLNAEKEELNDTITSLNSQKDNLATEIENLESEKEELETTITSLNSQIATLESNVEELEQDNADLSDQIDELEISISNLTTANTTLQNQLNAVSVDKTQLQATITTLNTEINRLENIIESLTLDNEDIEEQLATAQATITSLNATITTLNTQKTNLENSITSLQANYDELSEEYETLETIKNNINNQLDALQEDFDELTASYEEFRNEYGEYVENYENILTAYRELLDTNNGAIDIKGIMFDTLSMPFVFINKAFDITLFSGTAFAINIANLIKDILALLAILFLFGLFKKGLGAF